jgi:uncharacterized FlaG/YvyC family protein
VVVVNIGAVADTTSVKTGAKVVITMPLPGSSREGRPPDKVEEQRSAKNEQMKQMVQEMQSQIDSMNVSLEFSTYGENGEKIAVVVADTGEVIREIPSKEIQNLYAKMREITGILFNMQA